MRRRGAAYCKRFLLLERRLYFDGQKWFVAAWIMARRQRIALGGVEYWLVRPSKKRYGRSY